MRLSSLLFFGLLLSFTACASSGPVAPTYTPPVNPGGRMCTLQCGEARVYCDQSCEYKFRGCIRDMQSQAMRDYTAYTKQQFAAGQPIEFRPRDFEHTGPCDEAKKTCQSVCESTYGVCYKNCGGTVGTAESCHFFCF